VITAAFEPQATPKAGNTSIWYERIMFRVSDAVKFGASGVCPICNSAFGSQVNSKGYNHRTAC